MDHLGSFRKMADELERVDRNEKERNERERERERREVGHGEEGEETFVKREREDQVVVETLLVPPPPTTTTTTNSGVEIEQRVGDSFRRGEDMVELKREREKLIQERNEWMGAAHPVEEQAERGEWEKVDQLQE